MWIYIGHCSTIRHYWRQYYSSPIVNYKHKHMNAEKISVRETINLNALLALSLLKLNCQL